MTSADIASDSSNKTVEEQVENVVAIAYKNHTIGAAFYNHEHEMVYFLHDQYIKDPSEWIEYLRIQTNPRVILISSQSDDVIFKSCQCDLGIIQTCEIETRPTHDFQFEQALKRLSLEIEQNIIEATLNVADNKLTIGCAGCIVNFLKTNKFRVQGIANFQLKEYMKVSPDTLKALNIFSNELHPNTHSSRHKEGCSLFGILCRTVTCLGPPLLRQWFLRPLLRIEDIVLRQDAVQMLLNPANSEIIDVLYSNLKNIKNIPWKKAPIDVMQNLRLEFEHKIDFQESAEQGRIVIKPLIDQELDEMKQTYHGLDSFLSVIAQRVMDSITTNVPCLNVIYFPQIGYLITIPEAEDLCIPAEFELQFRTETQLYFKNDQMRELDNDIGDIHSEILDLELEYMQKFREFIMENIDAFELISSLIAELDCLLAFAKCAAEYRYSCPDMSLETGIILDKSRHPLLELKTAFVPNDIKIKENKSILLTGPNSSGKTVYLTQIALIVYMAHLGSFVPCERAVIGITPSILTCIQIPHSVSSGSTSSWVHDVQAAFRLLEATSQDLVLLDEFGQGTQPHDGIGIFCSVLNHLSKECKPIMIAATHFHECVTYNYVTGLELRTMECQWQQELVYLYKVVDGISKKSLAVECALKVGLDEAILERIRTIATCIGQGSPLPIIEQQKHEIAKAKEICKIFLKNPEDAMNIARAIKH